MKTDRPMRGGAPPPPPEDALPAGRTAFGGRNVRFAWLVGPTAESFAGGPLGPGPRASALRVMFDDGALGEAVLPPGQYFEDFEPRIADIDGDGRDEVLAVRIRPDRGASLAVFAERDVCDDGSQGIGRPFAQLTETRPLVLPEPWLNPVAVADFDGDGKPEIALIAAPHAGGTLEIYRFVEGRTVRVAQAAGYSNHVAGSPVMRLSAAADMDGDGNPDVVTPTSDRRALAVLSFAGGVLREIRREPLPSPAVGAFSVVSPQTTGGPAGKPAEVRLELENGEKFTLRATGGPAPVPGKAAR